MHDIRPLVQGTRQLRGRRNHPHVKFLDIMQMLKYASLNPLKLIRLSTTKLIGCVQFGMLFFAGMGIGFFVVMRGRPVFVVIVLVRDMVVFMVMRDRGDVGCGVHQVAVRLRCEHEAGCSVPERFQRLFHRLALGAILGSMLESDDIHPGQTKLDEHCLAFDDHIKRSMTVGMGFMLTVLMICRPCRRDEDSRHQNRPREHPVPGCRIPNGCHSTPSQQLAFTRRLT